MPQQIARTKLYYDSLSRVIEDAQEFGGNTRNATNEQFTSYPVTQMAFPNGRQISNSYDALYRRTLVEETSGGADIAAWEFFGPARVAEVTLGNGLIRAHLNNARTHSAVQQSVSNPAWGDDSSDRLGYDGAGRMITKRYLSGGINGTTGAYDDPTAVVGQTTAYDKASNKLYERSLQAESRSSLYEPFDANNQPEGGYDSIDRLRQYQRGVLSSTGGVGNAGGGSVTTPISLPNTDESRDYDLDGLGNWKKTTFDPVGGSEETQIRQHNSLNEITSTKDEGQPKDDLSYDLNGNLLDDGVRTYEWDALNRLKKVYKTPSSPVLVVEYTYDALRRRIRKVVTNDGLSGDIPNGTADFLYHSGIAQCCQERDGSNDATKQYVWGIYIDELLQMKTAVAINGNVAGVYYPLSDTLYRTVALTDDAGDLVEAYDTDAYGNTLIFVDPGSAADWWADDAIQGANPTCDFIFTGRRYDSESDMLYYRRRYYLAKFARFISRDLIEIWKDETLYAYVGENPVVSTDPRGLQKVKLMQPACCSYCRFCNRSCLGWVFAGNAVTKQCTKPQLVTCPVVLDKKGNPILTPKTCCGSHTPTAIWWFCTNYSVDTAATNCGGKPLATGCNKVMATWISNAGQDQGTPAWAECVAWCSNCIADPIGFGKKVCIEQICNSAYGPA